MSRLSDPLSCITLTVVHLVGSDVQHITASRLLGLCLFSSVIRTGLLQQEWLSALTQQVFGTTYSASQDNTTRLIQGYYEDPFPQAAPPAAVMVARGDHSSKYQERPSSCMSILVPVYDALKASPVDQSHAYAFKHSGRHRCGKRSQRKQFDGCCPRRRSLGGKLLFLPAAILADKL